MDRKEKIEIIQEAIKQLIQQEEEEQNTNLLTSSFSSSSTYENFVTVDNNHHQLLPKLLAELESLELNEQVTEEPESSQQIDEENSNNKEEIIIKELKNLKRQNLITQCLLSAMIVLTLAWQLSEVSLILKIKDGLSNPLKSVGGLIGGFWKGGRRRAEADVLEAMKNATAKQKQVIESSSFPGLKIPHLDLPGFDITSEEED